MVSIFSEYILDMGSFIPNQTVTVDDRDAPWVTPEVKKILQKKTENFIRPELRMAEKRMSIIKFNKVNLTPITYKSAKKQLYS